MPPRSAPDALGIPLKQYTEPAKGSFSEQLTTSNCFSRLSIDNASNRTAAHHRGLAIIPLVWCSLLLSAFSAAAQEPAQKGDPVAPDSSKLGPRIVRARIGGAFFSSDHWSIGQGEYLDSFRGGAITAEVALGKTVSRHVGMYLSSSLTYSPAPKWNKKEPYWSEAHSDLAWFIMFGPMLNIFFKDPGLELDIMLGAAFASNHFKYEGGVAYNLDSWGLGYDIALSYNFALEPIRLGPYLQWQHSSVGDIFTPGENANTWRTKIPSAGLQIWF